MWYTHGSSTGKYAAKIFRANIRIASQERITMGKTTDTNIIIFLSKCFFVGEKPNASV